MNHMLLPAAKFSSTKTYFDMIESCSKFLGVGLAGWKFIHKRLQPLQHFFWNFARLLRDHATLQGQGPFCIRPFCPKPFMALSQCWFPGFVGKPSWKILTFDLIRHGLCLRSNPSCHEPVIIEIQNHSTSRRHHGHQHLLGCAVDLDLLHWCSCFCPNASRTIWSCWPRRWAGICPTWWASCNAGPHVNWQIKTMPCWDWSWFENKLWPYHHFFVKRIPSTYDYLLAILGASYTKVNHKKNWFPSISPNVGPELGASASAWSAGPGRLPTENWSRLETKTVPQFHQT